MVYLTTHTHPTTYTERAVAETPCAGRSDLSIHRIFTKFRKIYYFYKIFLTKKSEGGRHLTVFSRTVRSVPREILGGPQGVPRAPQAVPKAPRALPINYSPKRSQKVPKSSLKGPKMSQKS